MYQKTINPLAGNRKKVVDKIQTFNIIICAKTKFCCRKMFVLYVKTEEKGVWPKPEHDVDPYHEYSKAKQLEKRNRVFTKLLNVDGVGAV